MAFSARIYISYSRKDAEIVKMLSSRLNSYGIETLYDDVLIEPGTEWKGILEESISNADGILALISPNSISSNSVGTEIGMARGLKKFLLPVIYGDVAIPDFIRDIQVIFWKGDDNRVIEQIARAIIKAFERKETKSQSKTPPTKPTPPSFRNYYLLKLNPSTWEIEKFKVGDNTIFNTHYFKEKRPEYELFAGIKSGDLVIGFAAGSEQCVVCEMEVGDPVVPDMARGEIFKMTIKTLTNPRIPLKDFQDKISSILPELHQNNKPPRLLFKITEETYHSILKGGAPDTPERKFVNTFLPFILSEGNHVHTQDQLDFENDIHSFASVIALKKVEPPLAIGLFGNWGSGKSFFMEKLADQIAALSNSGDPDFVQHVVPVKFNSWHYSDTNLWASLITQIFESLNDYAVKKEYGPEAINNIYKELDITNQQLTETQRKLDANTEQENALVVQKVDVEKTIQQKSDALEIWNKGDFIKVVYSDPYIQQDFENIKAQFKGDELIDNLHQIDEKITEVDSLAGRVIESFAILKKNHKGKWIWVWILMALAVVGTWLVLGPLKDVVQHFIDRGIVISSLVIAALTNFFTKLNPYLTKFNNFYKRLVSLKQTIDTEKEKVKLRKPDEVARLEKELRELKEQKATLDLKQSQIKEKKAQLENELKEIGSGRLLASFLAARSADDAYMKQLGIISWIRRDFSKLNDIFQKQRTVQQSEKEIRTEVQIDRIVLYIDDLDRCNEDVVVKVLEAIHLLLAFKLFVVVVGVDPRWLNNALSEKYKRLFGSVEKKKAPSVIVEGLDDTDEINLDEPLVATSYDYLEKIFQIPFALKPIDKTGREKLIRYLIKDELKDDVITGKVPPPPPTPENQSANGGKPNAPTNVGGNKEHVGVQTTPVEPVKKTKERLVFTTDELAFMQQISPLFGHSPRTINRYVNIYRIIKAHGNLKVVGDYSKEEFMPVMFMLGVTVGHSYLAEEFIAEVSISSDHQEFKFFLDNSKIDARLKAQIKPVAGAIENLSMKDFKRNIELISRFSFRTLLRESK